MVVSSERFKPFQLLQIEALSRIPLFHAIFAYVQAFPGLDLPSGEVLTASSGLVIGRPLHTFSHRETLALVSETQSKLMYNSKAMRLQQAQIADFCQGPYGDYYQLKLFGQSVVVHQQLDTQLRFNVEEARTSLMDYVPEYCGTISPGVVYLPA